jgi:hypothetical protein
LRRTYALLALACILLVADGYWASHNLVLKHSNVLWIPFDPMLDIVFEKDEAGNVVQPDGANSGLRWRNDQWVANDLRVADLGAFMEPYGYHSQPYSRRCVLKYYADDNISIGSAMKSLNAAFAAGAARAVILSPRSEVDGQAQNSVPAYNAPNPIERIC